MSTELYVAFIAACALLAVTPGPAMSLIIANGATYGSLAALQTVAGNTIGLGILVAAVILGMSTVMAAVASWFEWIRWIGAAYLIWLGVARIRRAMAKEPPQGVRAAGGRHWFWQGFAVALSNPKVLLFLGAFFPHFVNPAAALGPQFLALGAGFLLTLAIIDAGMAIAAASARAWLTARRWRLMDGFSGCLLIGGGVALAVARR